MKTPVIRSTSPIANQLGTTLIEYSLLLALIALIAFPLVGLVGTSTQTTFSQSSDAFEINVAASNGALRFDENQIQPADR